MIMTFDGLESGAVYPRSATIQASVPQATRAQRVIDLLLHGRESLRCALMEVFAKAERRAHPEDPLWLAQRLEAVLRVHNAVFRRHHGAAQAFEVFVEEERVVVSCGRGRMVLRYTSHLTVKESVWSSLFPRGGWISDLLGLHGIWLVRHLMSWPGLRVPVADPLDSGEVLEELRLLLHDPSSAVLVRLSEVLDDYIDPVIHRYVDDLLSSWPEEFRGDLRRFAQGRVIEEGLAAMRAQMEAEVGHLLQDMARRTPGDMENLHGPLQQTLDHYATLWNLAMDDRARLVVMPWQEGHSHGISLVDWRDESSLRLAWRAGQWAIQIDEGRLETPSELLLRHATSYEWDELEDEEDSSWVYDWDAEVPANMEAFAPDRAQVLLTPDELQDQADLDWLRENRAAHLTMQGLERGHELGVDVDLVMLMGQQAW